MFRSCFYDTRGNTIHLWETVNGKRIYGTYNWVPYTFVSDKDGKYKTIDGRKASKVEFRTYKEYYDYCKDNPYIFENKVKPEIQFLTERYHGIPDDEIEVPALKIYSIDIEVIGQKGFPDIHEAEDPIVLVSITDSMRKRVVTFGEKKYRGSSEGLYIHCPTEKELILNFLNFLQKHPADVYTGWNIWGFDLPYIINRCKKLWGEDAKIWKRLSPINVVKTWQSRTSEEMNIDIAGVHILDYLNLYKWYSPVKLESYRLDYVAKFELEKGKVDYSEYQNLFELYIGNWDKFVEYNRIDTLRVDQLEDKKGYIKLVQALSLLTKCPMKFYSAMTQLIEGALLTHYRRNNMCAPFFAGGTQEGFQAAYVKPPQMGMHDWVIDIDITSSYPSHIITLNMSNETFFGRIVDIQEEDVISYTRNKNFPRFTIFKDNGIIDMKGSRLKKFNLALEKGLFAIAPCGSVFVTKPIGVIADVEKNIFFKRKEVKNRWHILEEQAAERKDEKEKEKLKVRAQELFSLQWAIKILLNAVFGITAVPYSRYFNPNIAEAITSCGRHTIKEGQRFTNEYFKELGIDEDMVAYIDTDSLFIRLGKYFEFKLGEEKWESLNDEKKIEMILDFSKEIEKYVNNRIYDETQVVDYNSQVDDFKIGFKQEIVAKKALFVKKKKYAYWVVNKEGVTTDELSVTGLEIVRSDSAEAVRVMLKDVYEKILKDGSDDEIMNLIEDYKNKLYKVSPEEMAANVTVNGIKKYIKENGPEKGTPWHVKGTWNYKMLLKNLKIDNKYEEVEEGTKGKVLYVKPNKFGVDVVTFTRWPHEFDKYITIDYDKMIEKFFMKKIGFLLEPMDKINLLEGKEAEETIDAFFA